MPVDVLVAEAVTVLVEVDVLDGVTVLVAVRVGVRVLVGACGVTVGVIGQPACTVIVPTMNGWNKQW